MNKLIKLTPLDYYFFGGEETFDNGAKGKKNFHVKSNVMPQQTGLAGLIRHQLYLAGYDIGNESFNGTIPQWQSLVKLSPLFLVNSRNECLLPCPLIFDKEKLPFEVKFDRAGDFTFRQGKWQPNAINLTGYDAKEYMRKYWINFTTNEIISENDIFINKNHIGIHKEKRIVQQDDTGAFYQQEFISLNKDFSFCAFVTFSANVVIENLQKTMPLGGEKRSFNVGYLDPETSWEELKTKATATFDRFLPQDQCIILLSDTFVGDIESLYCNTKANILYSKPFRNIFTPTEKRNVNFAKLTKTEGKQDQLRKASQMVKILGKGSVLFPTDLQKCEKLLTNEPYSAIGYNQFISIH